MSAPVTSRAGYAGKFLTTAVLIASLGFLAWSAYGIIERGAGVSWNWSHGIGVLPVALVHGVLFCGLGFAFWGNVRTTSGLEVPAKPICGLFLTTNLARYLPGNIFHLVGRHLRLHQQYGIPHADLGTIQLFDLGFIFAANLILWLGSMLLTADHGGLALAAGFGIDLASPLPWVAMGTVLGLLLLFVLWGRHQFPLFQRVLQWKNLSILAGLFAATVLIYFLYGVLFLVLCQSLFPELVSSVSASTLFSSFVLAFLLGFVLPGAPGGLGVREAVLVLSLGSALGEARALEAALLFRAGSLTGDLLAGGAGWLLARGARDDGLRSH